ncbi:hypothetical protein GCWU000325_00867 [Alloprevotella tannerae ATCC 51259]|uniref:Uncharacterized protein n=1 Tax=Alloprevotella tannerae ATCC 51259 TaxID=626522 RepID=C9LF86_9BACT|nr:hypothetical protein GCWU000325_00867 [Alloprevotella tannerae ATCC 51259]
MQAFYGETFGYHSLYICMSQNYGLNYCYALRFLLNIFKYLQNQSCAQSAFSFLFPVLCSLKHYLTPLFLLLLL